MKNVKLGMKIGGAVALLWFVVMVMGKNEEQEIGHRTLAQIAADSAQQAREEIIQAKQQARQNRENKIKEQFSPWDGSHRALEDLIKENMNDPDSYEHIETRYSVNLDVITVETKFRGANALGGKVVQVVKAQYDIDGNLIKIIQ